MFSFFKCVFNVQILMKVFWLVLAYSVSLHSKYCNFQLKWWTNDIIQSVMSHSNDLFPFLIFPFFFFYLDFLKMYFFIPKPLTFFVSIFGNHVLVSGISISKMQCCLVIIYFAFSIVVIFNMLWIVWFVFHTILALSIL